MPQYNSDADDCRWIFGYGSLMWRPGFEFKRQMPAKLSGYHRRLSVFSNHYRGTFEKPGLVLGLDTGGNCAGLAFEVAEENWAASLDYVRKRELISDVYREIVVPIFLEGCAEQALAVTYVVEHHDQQYAPPMSVEETMAIVVRGQGISGSCVDYISNTLKHLRNMGIHDMELERLAPALNALGDARH